MSIKGTIKAQIEMVLDPHGKFVSDIPSSNVSCHCQRVKESLHRQCRNVGNEQRLLLPSKDNPSGPQHLLLLPESPIGEPVGQQVCFLLSPDNHLSPKEVSDGAQKSRPLSSADVTPANNEAYQTNDQVYQS